MQISFGQMPPQLGMIQLSFPVTNPCLWQMNPGPAHSPGEHQPKFKKILTGAPSSES